ncbi:MAG: branched-chain amino acid transport system substrate-binding protein [Chloroflexota bacterium]|jgi:branched-chain amino acid transport system substrate-binding protein|nr:branched-chain amino acid transport system substrate-binding protein [Chloroflexota bacterium]
MHLRKGLALAAGAVVGLAACGSSSSAGTTGCTNLNATALGGSVGAPSLANAADMVAAPATVGGAVVKIGFQGMLAGSSKNYGIDAKNGVQMAIDDAGGGFTFNGTPYTLEVDAQDDVDATAAGAQTAAQKLADDKVVAVVGGIFSTASIAAQKIYHDNGIAQISPSATNPKYTDQQPTPISSFRVIGRDDQQGPIGADLLVKTLGCKNIAVVDDKSTYGAGLAAAAATQIPVDGGTVVATEHVTAGPGGDFKSQLTTIKGKNPDAIYYGGYSQEAGPFAKQAKDLGLNIPIAGGDGWQNSDFKDLAGASGDGAFASNGGPAVSSLTDFQAKYKAKFNQDVFQYAPQAYDATNIIIAALKKDGPDKAKIIADIGATKDYKGISGTISFNSKGDVIDTVFTIWKFTGGDWKPFKPVTTHNPTS